MEICCHIVKTPVVVRSSSCKFGLCQTIITSNTSTAPRHDRMSDDDTIFANRFILTREGRRDEPSVERRLTISINLVPVPVIPVKFLHELAKNERRTSINPSNPISTMASTGTGEPADTPSAAVPKDTTPEVEEIVEDAPGEATLLVSEFPPPPYYYQQVVSSHLPPPPIPEEALARGTRRAAAAAARAREETERLRAGSSGNDDKTNVILGGATTSTEEEEQGDVVAVFGEIVEVN